MKKLTLALLISSALAGCASYPKHYDKPLGATDLQTQKADEWGAIPALTFMQSRAGVVVRKYHEVPASIMSRPIKLKFNNAATPTLRTVLFALGAQGFRLVPQLDDTLLAKPWTGNFEGTVGELLRDISVLHNLAFEYRNGAVYLLTSNRFSAALPQHKEFLERVVTALKEMGATDARADVLSGQVYYTAKPDVAAYLSDYLESIARNAAMVSLQVAVLTVSMDREVNIGFDWAKFAVMRGSGGMRSNLSSLFGDQYTPQVSATGNLGTDMATNVSNAAAQTLAGSLVSYVGGEGFGYRFANKAFSLTAALKALSTYGDARTEQNVILGTLSGLPVTISSGDDIPYVKSIGSSTAAGGAISGSTTTENIRSGLQLEVTPNFDASDGMLVTSVKVDMSTLVGFRELSAGANLGTLSQPQMKNLGFENVGRLNAGDTVIIGGISYDQLSNNYTNFPGMEKLPTGSKAEKVTRNAIYIVVRPSVVVFTPNANEMNAKLRALEAQAQAPAPASAMAGETK